MFPTKKLITLKAETSWLSLEVISSKKTQNMRWIRGIFDTISRKFNEITRRRLAWIKLYFTSSISILSRMEIGIFITTTTSRTSSEQAIIVHHNHQVRLHASFVYIMSNKKSFIKHFFMKNDDLGAFFLATTYKLLIINSWKCLCWNCNKSQFLLFNMFVMFGSTAWRRLWIF